MRAGAHNADALRALGIFFFLIIITFLHISNLFTGPFVRLSPNHQPITNPNALTPIFGHVNACGALKSEFHSAFVSIGHEVFSTHD